MREAVYGLSDKVRHKSGCTTTEDGERLDISDLESREKVHVLSMYRKHRRRSAARLPCSCSVAPLFSHMKYDAA